MTDLALKALRFLSKPMDDDTRSNVIARMLDNGHDTAMRVIANKSEPLNAEEFKFVLTGAGPLDDTHNMLTDDITGWDDSILDAYAEHINNYIYKYREAAKDIDSSIDTEEEQIGPMAQDIEQVNPACVDSLPDGTKTVDTNKLALMNAGAIADLARKLDKLIQHLEGQL